MKGRVLIVAGSDSGGGAGIQADIKTVTMFGGFAMTAIAALTVQDTTAVHDVMAIPASFVAHQMEVVLKDIGADAVKIGMLANAEIVAAVADMLEAHAAEVPVVLDPVMVATSGGVLLVNDAVSALKSRLVSRATVVTPNIPETEVLVGRPVRNVADMTAAGREILKLGPRAVLVKGGHLDAPEVIDILVTADGVHEFRGEKIVSRNTHGTGCTLSSAIAAGLARGDDLVQAVARARAYVAEGIRLAPGFGSGHGPLNHVDAVAAI